MSVLKMALCCLIALLICCTGYSSELDEQFHEMPIYYEDDFDPEDYWAQRSVMFGIQFFTPEIVSKWEDQYIYGGDLFDTVETLGDTVAQVEMAMDAVARHFDKMH